MLNALPASRRRTPPRPPIEHEHHAMSSPDRDALRAELDRRFAELVAAATARLERRRAERAARKAARDAGLRARHAAKLARTPPAYDDGDSRVFLEGDGWPPHEPLPRSTSANSDPPCRHTVGDTPENHRP
jgi:hypothetical protein